MPEARMLPALHRLRGPAPEGRAQGEHVRVWPVGLALLLATAAWACPAPSLWYEALITPDAGFFSLAEYRGALIGGTYGTPRVHAIREGVRFDLPGVESAGESVFDFQEYSIDGALYATTEARGIYRLNTVIGKWERVFLAPAPFNNSYSLVEYRGYLLTGFKNFPDNDRTLLAYTRDGQTWQTRVVGGWAHMRFAVYRGDLVSCGHDPEQRAGCRVWRDGAFPPLFAMAGFFMGVPYVWRDRLYVGVETGDTASALYRWDGERAEIVHSLPDQRLLQQLVERRGVLYLLTGVRWRAEGGRAQLWSSEDGAAWHLVREFDEPEGWALASYMGALCAGTRQEGGHGKVYCGSE